MITTPTHIEQIRKIINDAEKAIFDLTGMPDARLALYSGREIAKSPVIALAVIAEALGMSYDDYTNGCRDAEYVTLRRCAIMCLYTLYPSLTYKRIAELVGGYLSHSVIDHHIQTAQDFIEVGDDSFCKPYKIAYSACEAWLKE